MSESLGIQAITLYSLGDLDAALRLHKESESLCRETGHKRGLQVSLGNQAIILARQGNAVEAESLLAEQERLCRELGDPRGLMYCSVNRAQLLTQELGRADQALPLAEQAYELAVRHGYNAMAPRIKSTMEWIRSQVR